MIREACILAGLILMAGLAGCSPLNAELVKALAKDDAAVCVASDIRGGAGMVAGVPSGGYGQGTLNFCRSNKANSKLEIKPDGSMSVTTGDE